VRSRLIPLVAVLVDVGYVAYFFSYCTIYNFKNSVQNILKYGQFLIDKDKILSAHLVKTGMERAAAI
jgi:hypothetical protein